VRAIAEGDGAGASAALGSRVAAELYGCEVLCADVDDAAGNETRFVWLAPAAAAQSLPAAHGPFKTAIVFWGVGAEAPGWLVRCLSEFAFRGVNLTRIESRPRKQGLGRYMFFCDLEGRAAEGPVADALDALRAHVEHLRVLGSFPVAPAL
jgi:prephenate dehydratase